MQNLFSGFLVYAILCDVVVLPKKNKHKSEFSRNIRESENPRDDISAEKLWIQGPTDYEPVTAKAPGTLPPYFGFLTNICKALLSPKYRAKHLHKYLSILSNSLIGLGIDYLQKIWIKRFRKRLKKYSIYTKKRIKLKVNDFLMFISDGKPKKKEYFKAMDAIYTVADDLKMDEYVYLLKKYGKGELKHIGDNTRRVFERIVFGRYHRQSEDVKSDIELKFKSAAVEYWEERLNGTAFNFTLSHLFNFTLSRP